MHARTDTCIYYMFLGLRILSHIISYTSSTELQQHHMILLYTLRTVLPFRDRYVMIYTIPIYIELIMSLYPISMIQQIQTQIQQQTQTQQQIQPISQSQLDLLSEASSER